MLAAVGLYGVLSFAITRRQGEIAIRIAVGARPGSVIAMILRETSGLILVGLALGAGLAYAASRWITSQLYGVAPQDPLTLTLAAGMLVVVALLATFLPAQQASRLDPMAALRRE
jgi:ABC-type antimicrobial peptide transport system permease subunit